MRRGDLASPFIERPAAAACEKGRSEYRTLWNATTNSSTLDRNITNGIKVELGKKRDPNRFRGVPQQPGLAAQRQGCERLLGSC